MNKRIPVAAAAALGAGVAAWLRRRRKLGTAAMLALMMVATSCGTVSNTEAAELACVFNGGEFDSKDFRQYQPPGAGRERNGVGSNVVEVPLRLLTYAISLDPNRGDTPVSDSLAVNVGGMRMEFEPTVAFKMNTVIDWVGNDGSISYAEQTIPARPDVRALLALARDRAEAEAAAQAVAQVSAETPVAETSETPVDEEDLPTEDEADEAAAAATEQIDPDTVSTVGNATTEGTVKDGEGTGLAKPRVCELVEIQLNPFNATDFDTEGGQWQFFWLNEKYRPWLDTSGTRTLQGFNDPVAMFFNEGGYRDAAAIALGYDFSEELNRALGGRYFCGPDHTFGSTTCSPLVITLPKPEVSSDDEETLNGPRVARTNARTAIAKAEEAARQAEFVAAARTRQAQFAEEQATADEIIARQEARSAKVADLQDLEWCVILVDLGQNCALVRAADNGVFPMVIGSDALATIPVDVQEFRARAERLQAEAAEEALADSLADDGTVEVEILEDEG